MINRAKEIYEAAVSYADKGDETAQQKACIAHDVIWMAQCTDAERAEALRMLDARAAGRST